jgi:asparagine synthase (glutamine-hydrolysing)
LFSTDKSLCLCANGEIYNYKKLSSLYLSTVNFATSSDCEVIVHLYEKFGNDFVKYLDGMFSFVISDSRTGEYYAARDPIGITSFYYGYDKEGKMWFASELKALQDVCVKISEFPPGCYYSSVKGVFVPYFKPLWHSENFLPEPQELHLEVIREALTAAVKKRLMTSVPFGVLLWVCTVFFFLRSFVCVPGVLLSGGLDSSLIASIVSRFFKNDTAKLHTFSVGFPNSPDVKAAKVVADFLGTSHHSFQFSLQEGLEAVPGWYTLITETDALFKFIF